MKPNFAYIRHVMNWTRTSYIQAIMKSWKQFRTKEAMKQNASLQKDATLTVGEKNEPNLTTDTV